MFTLCMCVIVPFICRNEKQLIAIMLGYTLHICIFSIGSLNNGYQIIQHHNHLSDIFNLLRGNGDDY